MELEEKDWKKWNTLQKEYKTKYKDRLEADKKETLERYIAKVAALKKAKAKMLKEYNARIKKYQALVNELKADPPKPKSSKKTK